MRFPRPVHLATCVAALALVPLAACGGDGADEAPVISDTTGQDDVMNVPDSTIDRELTERIEADPRLAGPGIELSVRSEGGLVWMRGRVPTRYEMSIAREVALSAPGVENVIMDSLVVESDERIEVEGT